MPGADAPGIIAAEDADALAEEASSLVMGWIVSAIREHGGAHVVLAGGGTPRKTHAAMAAAIRERDLPRDAVHWWFGDERWVPVSDAQSNEGMARQTLLGPAGIADHLIHSWGAGAGEPADCASRYGQAMSGALGGRGPDVVMLGVGPDGHTASLFPGSTIALPGGRELPMGPRFPDGSAAAAVRGGSLPGWRLTLSPGMLGSARHVLFLATGADKRDAVRRAVNGDPGTPAAWVRGMTTTFIVTRDVEWPADTGHGPKIVIA
ncbi:MAG TPA: 6-phosphogluconolactonase [Spirochaetia bacterium]|nr:6-phosphogluconolactonase [Spirochaetia bacterium]